MELTLGNHPAQARHPVTSKPLFDRSGEPVPHKLVENQRSIRLDGFVIAYVIPTKNDTCRIHYLARYQALPEACLSEVRELVEREFMPVEGESKPIIVQADETEDDEINDEDE